MAPGSTMQKREITSYSSSSSLSSAEEIKDRKPKFPKSLDELPTDDSGSDLDSSSSDFEDENVAKNDESESSFGSGMDRGDNSKNEFDDSDKDIEDQTLEERLQSRQQNGTLQRKTLKQTKPDLKYKSIPSKRTKASKKHAPKEVSSKRKDYFRRGAPLLANSGIATESSLGVNRYKSRDPRMESLSDHFDQGAFNHNFSFIQKMRENEIEQLKEKIAARKLKGRKGQRKRKNMGISSDQTTSTLETDENELKRLLQLRSDNEKSRMKNEVKSAIKQKMKEEIKSGKRSKEFYFKKKDLKRKELEAQYDLMKKKGGDAAINKALAKKRKKNLGRDGKFMSSK